MSDWQKGYWTGVLVGIIAATAAIAVLFAGG